MAKAKTFLDDQTIVVTILSEQPSSTGLCKVVTEDGKTLARHIDRLEPLDDSARVILSNGKWSPYH